MLKKVTGVAKDKLKHHLHHNATTSRPRSHSHGTHRSSFNSSVTLKAVDNDAFEKILDDESEFLGEVDNQTPTLFTSGSSTTTSSAAAKATNITTHASTHPSSYNSDLFDSDLFNNDIIEDDQISPEKVDYDPLSGQIVSKHVASNFDDHLFDDEDGTNHENETDIRVPATDNLDYENGNSMASRDGTNIGGETTESVESSNTTGIEDIPESLIQNAEKLEPPSSGNVEPESKFTEAFSIPQVDNSSFSPTPSSSLENDGCYNMTLTEDKRLSPEDKLLSPDDETEIRKRNLSENYQVDQSSSEATHIVFPSENQINSPLDTFTPDIEFKQSIASEPSSKIPYEEGVSDSSAGNSRQEQGSVDRDTSPSIKQGRGATGGKLDSGVFEHESDSTPERDPASSGRENDDDLITILEDHFTIPVNMSSAKKTEVTAFTNATQDIPVHSAFVAPVVLKRNSAGKIAPPRPLVSPRMKRRVTSQKKSMESTTSGESAREKHAKPLGSTEVQAEGHTKSPPSDKDNEERVTADDLFLEDSNKVEQTFSTRIKDTVPSNSHRSSSPTTSQPSEQNQQALKEIKDTTSDQTQEDAEPELTVWYHLVLSMILYFYYSLNIFPYLSGLFAGFLMLYIFLGAVFVYYVNAIEKERIERRQERKRVVEASKDFIQTMQLDYSKLEVYQSNNFTATLSYNPSTHHRSQRLPAEIKLSQDFKLLIKVSSEMYNTHVFATDINIRHCTISIVPPEVASNRKRRWSKKFPIAISCPSGPKKFKCFFFSPTARDKEDWFRRLNSAASGKSSKDLINKYKEFVVYMEKYFPSEMLRTLKLKPPHLSGKKHHHSHHNTRPPREVNTRVEFSKAIENDESFKENPESSEINIMQKRPPPPQTNAQYHQSHMTQNSLHQSSKEPSFTRSSMVDEFGFEHIQRPVETTSRGSISGEYMPNQWLNSMAARLCWDVWHEQRWKDWVMTRIQKKLIRAKTPSFMEQLRLTNIDIGNDMPTVNRLIGGPRLDLKGIWVYLDVTYQGKFVMTIETKMKLGSKKDEEGQGGKGKEMTAVSPTKEDSRHKSSHLSHTLAAQALSGTGKGGSPSVDEDEIDSGSDEEEGSSGHHPLLEEDLTASQLHEGLLPTPAPVATTSTAHQQHPTTTASSKGKILSVVSRVAKRVANTKIVRRAAEKVSSYPLVLTVEVKRLDGILAVNIPPPPTDTVWWGFHGSPRLDLVAKPKLGQREVKLSRITHWIEKKLCDIVDKKVVLPEMEDLVIPILNSGMAEDKLKPI